MILNFEQLSDLQHFSLLNLLFFLNFIQMLIWFANIVAPD